MFSSMSFLFSLSLAFFTWIMLCYLKLLEDQRLLDDVRVELYTEYAQRFANYDQIGKCFEPTTSDTKKYLNLFWNFVCLCALAKLLQGFDYCMEKRKSPTLPPPPMPPSPPREPSIIVKAPLSSPPPMPLLPLKEPPVIIKTMLGLKPIRKPLPFVKKSIKKSCLAILPEVANIETESSSNLVTHLRQLESRCSELHKILTEIKDSKNVLVPVNSKPMINDIQAAEAPFNRVIMSDTHSMQPPMPSLMPQNIFITNSHIHISGELFVNQRNINIDLTNTMPVCAPKQSEFLQIWGQCVTKPFEPQPLIASMTRRKFLI